MIAYEHLAEADQIRALEPVAVDGAARLGIETVRTSLAYHGHNTTYRVTDPHGEDYAIRVLTNSVSGPDQLEAQHAWMHALGRDTPLRVPEPVRGSDGASFAVVPDSPLGRDAVVVATRWLPGRAVADPSPEQAHALGAAMATMHAHATRWQAPEGFTALDDPLAGNPDALTKAPLPAADVAVLVDAITDAREALAAISTPAPVPIHRDLHGGNLTWHQGQLAVFDFDDAGLGSPALDLAISTYYLRDKPGDPESAMRAGYRTVAPVPDVGDDTLQTLLASRQLHLANAVLLSTTASLRADAFGYLHTALARLRHWRSTGRFTTAVR